MKKQIKLVVILTLGLFILGIFASPVLADQKSEEKSTKAKTVEKLSARDEMVEILNDYFVIRDALAHDKTDDVAKRAQDMSQRLDRLIMALERLRAASDSLKAEDLKVARDRFGPLSEAVINYVKDFGFSGKAYSFRCDMAKESWLQEHDQIGNPYYGSRMYKCGKITGMIENGKYVEK